MAESRLPTIRQQLAADILPADHNYWDVLDLVPPSDEGNEQAQAESVARMEGVKRFVPFIDTYSTLAADIMSQVIYKNAATQIDLTNPEVAGGFEQWHYGLVIQNREVVRAAVYPILAAMLQANVITYGEKAMPGGMVGRQAQG